MKAHRFSILFAATLAILVSFAGAPALALTPMEFAYAAPPDYALSPQASIELQAVLRIESPGSDPTLNETLRTIDIRTALEDTARLRGDLG
jgi:hypothetical protein